MNQSIRICEEESKELIQQLVRIPSINPPAEVDECAKFIVEWLRKNKVEAEILKVEHVSNVVAALGDDRSKKILWNGHFDTVPPGQESSWADSAFSGSYKDGFVYGRGGSDMKGGIASMMLALKELKKVNVELNGQIIFMASGDEETGSVRGTQYYLKTTKNKFAAAMVSEPTNLNIEIGNRGLRWLQVKLIGKACHAGRPHIGKNAIEHAAKLITALKEIKFDLKDDIFEVSEPSLSVTMVEGGIKENIIPGDCTIKIDRRLMPGETEEKVVNEIQNVLDSIREEGFISELNIINKGWDPFIISMDEEIFQKTSKAYRDIMGEDAFVRAKGGCTDASHIYHSGIPVLIFGPGDTQKSHTINESVEVHKIAKCAEIYAQAAIEFLNK